jgi:ubiquinone/menaquinone biosynthesis C-methylase UbiE
MNPWRALVENPGLYDFVQRAAGAEQTRERLAPVLGGFTGSVLDVGAGTGNWSDLLPASTRYVALDSDERKLGQLRRKHPGTETILAEATAIPVGDNTFEHGLCVALSHHLSDDQLPALFLELQRVVSRRLVFLDAVRVDAGRGAIRSRAMWAIDRGSHPRDEGTLRVALEPYLEIERAETYDVYHRYLLVVASPRR